MVPDKPYRPTWRIEGESGTDRGAQQNSFAMRELGKNLRQTKGESVTLSLGIP